MIKHLKKLPQGKKILIKFGLMKQIITVVLLLAGISLSAQTKADNIIGVWLTGGKEPARIQVYRSGDKYYGKIVWLKYPEANGGPRLDKNNPDKNKQSQRIVGLVILKDFRFENEEWNDGSIYDPESGKTYKCKLSLKDNGTLNVRGYIGISLFGRTETWVRP